MYNLIGTHVHLLIHANILTDIRVAAAQCRVIQIQIEGFTLNIKMDVVSVTFTIIWLLTPVLLISSDSYCLLLL